VVSGGVGAWGSIVDRAPGEAVVGVEQWAELRRLHFVGGVSIRELQRRTGLHRATIRRELRTLELPRYRRRVGALEARPVSGGDPAMRTTRGGRRTARTTAHRAAASDAPPAAMHSQPVCSVPAGELLRDSPGDPSRVDAHEAELSPSPRPRGRARQPFPSRARLLAHQGICVGARLSGLNDQRAGVAAMGAEAGAVARVFEPERNLRVLGVNQDLVTALLAGVSVGAVAALGRPRQDQPRSRTLPPPPSRPTTRT